MPTGYNYKEALNLLFGESVFRVAAAQTAEEAKRLNILPKRLDTNLANIRKTSLTSLLGYPCVQYSIDHQLTETGPTVSVGIQSAEKQHFPFAYLSHHLWLADDSLLSFTFTLGLTVPTINASTPGYMFDIQCDGRDSNPLYHFTFDSMADSNNLKVTTYETTPFGILKNEQIFNAHTPIPDNSAWPQTCISLTAARVLDEERVRHIISKWPQTISDQWDGLNPMQALDELSALIISTNGA